MKSLWGRFKPAQAGPSSSRPSLDAAAAADRSDDTVKVSKTRSFRRPRLTDVHPETPTSPPDADLSHSHDYSTASHSSAAKELPPRPVTPGALADLSPPVPPKDGLDVPKAIEEWRANQHAHTSHSTENVKKVAFQSPQRPHVSNSEGDLRGRAAAASAGPSVSLTLMPRANPSAIATTRRPPTAGKCRAPRRATRCTARLP